MSERDHEISTEYCLWSYVLVVDTFWAYKAEFPYSQCPKPAVIRGLATLLLSSKLSGDDSFVQGRRPPAEPYLLPPCRHISWLALQQ